MEDVKQFNEWLYHMLKDAKEKLEITDETIAWVLLKEGTNYYFKTIVKHGKA